MNIKITIALIWLLALLALPGCGGGDGPEVVEYTEDQMAEREARHARLIAETEEFDAANQ